LCVCVFVCVCVRVKNIFQGKETVSYSHWGL